MMEFPRRDSPPVRFDGYMAYHSGIGTHIRGLLAALARNPNRPAIVAHLPDDCPVPEGLEYGPKFPGSLYGLRRRIYLPNPGPTALYHYPHWNVPLFGRRRAPRVVTVHDLNHLRIPELGRNPLRRAYIRRWIQDAIRSAATVVTGSNHARMDIATEFDLDPAQITIIGNGLPEDWHPHAPEEVDRRLTRLGIADRPYLLAVGNGKPHKNLAWLVQHADKWLQSQQLPHRIVLTNASAALAELSERVHITGHLNDADHRAVYQGAAAVVFPSRHEGFGLPVIEAQALRTPVACSNAASLPEVSGGPGCAALFDPTSPEELFRALARVLDPSEQPALLDNGEANAALYTWDRVAERVLSVWEKHL